MSFIKGALDALNNLFETIFSRLDALGDRTEVLESDFEKLAVSLEEAATHAAQYAVEVKFEELEDGEDLKDDIIRLADSVANREEEARDYFCRVESLEDQMEAHDGYWSHFEPKVNRLEGELKDALSRDNGLSARVDALEGETERLERDRGDMQSDLYHLESELKALKASHEALLKALEWKPPQD